MAAIPADWNLDADIVGALILCKLETAYGDLRFILNEEGWFDDVDGNRWLGSKFIKISDLDFSINGTAPAFEIGFSYTVDPEVTDLVTYIRQYGVAAVRNYDATFYLQYLAKHEEFYAAVHAPIVLARRKMMNLRYSFDGPKTRMVSVVVEGPMNLRSKPVNGRYTDADQRRRTGVDDPSFEFMPNNAHDEQSLFGL